MNVANLSSFKNDRNGSALFCADEVLLNSRGCENGRDGSVGFIYTAVAEDDDVVAFGVSSVDLREKIVEGRLQAGGFDTLASRALNHRRCNGG